MIRDQIKQGLISAMKGGDKAKTGTLRLVQSAIKNRDIELRGSATPPDDDLLITEVLQKMIKQRRESIEMYRKGGREELAEAEAAEIVVIEEYLPKQMGESEMSAAIDTLIGKAGAGSIKDMGRVMALVKERHAGELDLAKASQMVKSKLN